MEDIKKMGVTKLDKQVFYYDEMNVPTAMRIISKRLCLDHTFLPQISFPGFLSCEELIDLMNNPLFEVYAQFSEGSLYYIDYLIDPKVAHSHSGWLPLDPKHVELIPINKLPCDVVIS